MGALLVLEFFFVSSRHSESGNVVLPQPDSAIYMQYARAIAEGHPYRFQEQDPPSTGSTSHLYPFVLAVPYALGAKGDALVTAGFIIGGLCYLGIIALLYAISLRVVREMALPATLLAGVFNGHLLFACLGVTDVGLFALLAIALLAALLYERWVLAAVCIVLAVFTRPEGAILSASLFATGLMGMLLLKNKRKEPLPFLAIGSIGLMAVAGVALLNIALTGIPSFHSVLAKSPRLAYSTSEIIHNTCMKLLSLLQEVFFGLATSGRQVYVFPVLGGMLGLAGLVIRKREDTRSCLTEIAFLLAVVAAIILVASSHWCGLFWDRYFAWILPLWFLYIMIALNRLRQRFPDKTRIVKCLLIPLLFFQCFGIVYFATVTTRIAASVEPQLRYLKKMNQKFDKGETFMSNAYAGVMAYYLPGQYIVNIHGIDTPQLTFRSKISGNLEALKHWREMRPEFWIVGSEDETNDFEHFYGEQVHLIPSPPGFEPARLLYRSDWSIINTPDRPMKPQLQALLEHWHQVDRLDVAYPVHEERANYRTVNRAPGSKPGAFTRIAGLGDISPFLDAGRLAYGSETFNVHCPEPGADMLVVMRTGLKASVNMFRPPKGRGHYDITFPSSLKLRVYVNGQDIGTIEREIRSAPDDFDEIHFTIPGRYLQENELEIEIQGDYFSYGYWFYQPKAAFSRKNSDKI